MAHQPEMGTEYTPNIAFTANTLPAGKPFEFVPENVEEIVIPIIHIRRKIRRGKTIQSLAGENQYQITITTQNLGENAIQDVKVRDVVDENSFEVSDISHEVAEESDLEGKKMIIWNIESMEPEETVEITYVITGKGDYRASDNQFSV